MSGRPRPRLRRRGFLLYLLLGMLAVVGILLVSLDQLARQRNRLAHRSEWGRVAEGLADGTASYLQYLFRFAAHEGAVPASALAVPLANEALYGFLLQPADDLEASFARTRLDTFLERWFGPDWRTPVSDLEATFPGSKVTLEMALEADPLHPGPAFSDPIEKTVRLGLSARADYRGVVRTAKRSWTVKVTHPFPPAVSKFTLFVDNVPGGGEAFNVYENESSGASTGSPVQAPFVLWNTPVEDRTDLDRIADHGTLVEAGRPWGDQDAVRAALDDRGWVYLGTGPGNPGTVPLNLTAGPTLAEPGGGHGEFFQLYDPVRYGAQPTYFRLIAGAPNFFQAPITDGTGNQLKAFVNFLFWGFESSGSHDLEDAGLGSTLTTKRSSILHPFGSTVDPSRTRVLGPVTRRFVRFSYLAVDRKAGPDAAGPDDEDIQIANRDAAGLAGSFPIRDRDSVDPIFAYVPDAAAWEADLRRSETSGETPLHLYPLPVTGSSLPPPENRNFAVDSDGDGFKDVILDPGHPTVPLDPNLFRYRTMFPDGYDDQGGGRPGYRRFMSRVMEVPFPQVLDYMAYSGMIPPEEHPAFPGWTAGDLDADARANSVKFDFDDPLHRAAAKTRLFDGDLSSFLPSDEFEAIARRRVGVRVPDQTTFLRRFRLERNPLAPTDSVPLLALDEIVQIDSGGLDLPVFAYAGGGTIVVAGGDVRLRGVTPRSYSLLSLVVLDGDLILDGPGPFHLLAAVPRGELRNPQGTPLEIAGSLALGSLSAQALSRGGGIRYPSTADPTRYGGGSGVHYADFYHVAVSDAPTGWAPSE